MILIDTNILIEIYKNNTSIVETVKKIGQNNIAVSDITCAELYFGARNKKELQIIAKDLKKLEILHINTEIS
ncbi:MAG TPA: PIN domain-containing protein [Paludibacter sp.]